jgi:tetratricopeptide (TPR) repeat protein/DNA-binding CsgD family transcriptional regulator
MKHPVIFLFIAMVAFAACERREPDGLSVVERLSSVRNTVDTEKISVDSLNAAAIEQWRIGNYQQALTWITAAYRKSKAANNEPEIAQELNTLGLVYWKLENDGDAMESYTESGKLAEKHNMYLLLGLTHTNRGLIYKQQMDFQKAFFHNNSAIEIFRRSKEYRELAIALNNQGQIFKNQNKIDSAQAYYLRALENYKRTDYKDGVAATWYNIADVSLRQGRKDAALAAIRKSLSLSLEIDNKSHACYAYEMLSQIFERFHQPDSALKYYKKYSALNESILEANQSENLAKYQANMGAEVKNLRIRNLQKERELASNRSWFIGIGALMLLLVAAFVVYRYLSKIRYKKRKLELELSNSTKILNIREQELKHYIIDLTSKSAAISKLQEEMSRIMAHEKADTEVAQLLEQKILTEADWETFKAKFRTIYPAFFSRIKQHNIVLTEAEIRLMVLLHLDLSGKEMAKTLGISPQSVRVCKMRLKKKLQAEGFETVEAFLDILVR